MAARGRSKGFKMPQEHRDKIGSSNVLRRLIKHAEGLEPNMTPSEVTAALGLLRKWMPDLAAQELTVETATPYALIPEQIVDATAWEDAFTPSHKATEGDKPH